MARKVAKRMKYPPMRNDVLKEIMVEPEYQPYFYKNKEWYYYDDDDEEVFIGRDLAHAKAHSEAVSGEIDREVKMIIDECYEKAKNIILEHENVLHSCAKLLLEKEKIGREEFEGLFNC